MSLYGIRFSKGELAQKQRVWKALCERFLQKFVKGVGVLDLAAGHCKFINNIECAEKNAIELDPQCLESAKADVHAIRQSCMNLSNFREDFFDHKIPLSHKNICEALMKNGFEIVELILKFLPIRPNRDSQNPRRSLNYTSCSARVEGIRQADVSLR